MPYDPSTGQWVEDYNTYDQTTYNQPPPQQQAPAPFQSAPTAPPLYTSQPGSSYTGFDGQPGTVPTTPAASPNQTEYAALWQQTGQNPQQFVQALIAKLGLHGRQIDPTALNTIVGALKTVGVNASLDQRNDQYHKGIMLNGQFVKLLDGSDQWMWGAGQDASGGGGQGNYAIDPSFLAPYTKEFAAPADAALPQFQGPGAFKPPSVQDMQNDSSYKWEEGRITDAVQNSASAAGTLNSSGTLDRIMGSVSDFARTGWKDLVARNYGIWNSDWNHALSAYDANSGRANSVYNRALGEYDLGKRLFQENQDRPLNALFRGADLGSRGLD